MTQQALVPPTPVVMRVSSIDDFPIDEVEACRICRPCGSICAAHAVTCPNCGTAFRPVVFGLLCVFALVLLPIAVAAWFSYLCSIARYSSAYDAEIIWGFVNIALTVWAWFIWWRIRVGNAQAWREMQWMWGITIVIAVLSAVMTETMELCGMIVPILLFWAYFHAKSVKEYCHIRGSK